MDDKEYKELLRRYVNNQCSKEEKERLEALFDFYSKKDEWIEWDEQDPAQYKKNLLSDIKKDIKAQELRTLHPRPSKHTTWLKAAASIIIALGIGLLGYRTYLGFSDGQEAVLITKSTDYGQKTNIVLSDGSMVRLNSGSKLVFPDQFDGDIRKVSLSGEAFFEIQPNVTKPFVIETTGLTTTVLGTSFNVNAYPDQESIEVTVATGKVMIETFTGQHTSKDILESSQQAVYDRSSGSIETHTVSLEHFLAWKEGVIIFDDIQLREAVEILERWFNMEITLENQALGDCYISNKFENENLVNILESIKFIKNDIDYSFQDKNRILITGTCQP